MAKTPKKNTTTRRAIVLGQTALGAVADSTVAVPITEGFSVSVNGMVVRGRPTFEQCETFGLVLRTTERGIQFAIGDYLNFIDDHLGERASQIVDYTEGWSEKTCSVYSWLAKRIAPERRRMDRLGIRHHLLVAALTPTQQERWLTKAAADSEDAPWTVKRLQDAMKEGEDLPPTGFWVLALANDEADQSALMATLEGQGRTCKAVLRRTRTIGGTVTAAAPVETPSA